MQTSNQTAVAWAEGSRLFDEGSAVVGVGNPFARTAGVWRNAVRCSAAAQYLLAIAHINGKWLPQNYRKGTKWLRRAADRGHAKAQLNLGVAYARGKGVPRDLLMAHMWFSLAVFHGNGRAREYRLKLRAGMTAEEITVAEHMALDWRSAEAL